MAFGEVLVAGESEGGAPGAICAVSPPGVGFWDTSVDRLPAMLHWLLTSCREEEKAMGLNQVMARMSPEHVHWFENTVSFA